MRKYLVSCPFCHLWFCGGCFSPPAVDSSAKTEGNFPLNPLRKGSQPLCSCVPGFQGTHFVFWDQAFVWERWLPGRRRREVGWGWDRGHEVSRIGKRLNARRTVVGSRRRGSHPAPRRWQDLEWGMAAGMLSRSDIHLLSWGAAARLSGLVRRVRSCRATSLWGVCVNLAKEHLQRPNGLPTGLSPHPPRLNEARRPGTTQGEAGESEDPLPK